MAIGVEGGCRLGRANSGDVGGEGETGARTTGAVAVGDGGDGRVGRAVSGDVGGGASQPEGREGIRPGDTGAGGRHGLGGDAACPPAASVVPDGEGVEEAPVEQATAGPGGSEEREQEGTGDDGEETQAGEEKREEGTPVIQEEVVTQGASPGGPGTTPVLGTEGQADAGGGGFPTLEEGADATGNAEVVPGGHGGREPSAPGGQVGPVEEEGVPGGRHISEDGTGPGGLDSLRHGGGWEAWAAGDGLWDDISAGPGRQEQREAEDFLQSMWEGGCRSRRPGATGASNRAKAGVASSSSREGRTTGSGWRILDLCGGIGTVARSGVAAGWDVDAYWLVELGEREREMAERVVARTVDRSPGRFPLGGLTRDGVPDDVTLVTKEQIRALGRVDLVTASWPCQGLSRASRKAAGFGDGRSALFKECWKIFCWVREFNPEVRYVFENVVFNGRGEAHLEDAWEEVKEKLGEPLVFDAARVSPAHRLRAFWHNLGPVQAPTPAAGVDLAGVLDPGRFPRAARYTDKEPMWRANKRGEVMRKFPTVTASGLNTWSVRSGDAKVVGEDGHLDDIRVEELERLVGLWGGDTAVAGATEDERRKACGNIWDVHVQTYLFSHLPAVPGAAGRARREAEQRRGWSEHSGGWAEAALLEAWGRAEDMARSWGLLFPCLPPRGDAGGVWRASARQWLEAMPTEFESGEEGKRAKATEWVQKAAKEILQGWKEAGVARPGVSAVAEPLLGREAAEAAVAARESAAAGRAMPDGDEDGSVVAIPADVNDPDCEAEAYRRMLEGDWDDDTDAGEGGAAGTGEENWFEADGRRLRPEGWKAHGADPSVVKTVETGATFVFHREPESNAALIFKKGATKTDKNLPSVFSCGNGAGIKDIDRLIADGFLEDFSGWQAEHPGKQMKDFVRVFNKWGSVMKKGGAEARPYIDCTQSGCNEAQVPWPMRLPTPETVVSEVPSGWVVGSRDWRHGFHHVVVDEDHRRYLGVTHPHTGKVYRWKVLPFGMSQSPGIFWEVVLEAGKIFRRELEAAGLGMVKMWEYCDDVVLAAPSAGEMTRAFEVLDRVAEELGIRWKLSKDQGRAGDRTEIEVWGLVLSTAPMPHLYIPEDKKRRYKEELLRLDEGGSVWEADQLRSVIGQLSFCCRACRWGRGFLDYMWDGLSRAEREGHATVLVTADMRLEYDFWSRLLLGDEPVWEGRTAFDVVGARELVKGIHYTTFDTDASGEFGWGARWVEEHAAGKWEAAEAALGICWKELLAILQALKLWGREWEGCSVTGSSDNVAAIAAINSGRVRSREARVYLREVAMICTKYSIQLRMRHIAGALNVVPDKLSRGNADPSSACYKFRDDWYLQVTGGLPRVDGFCDRGGLARQPGCTEHFWALRSVYEHREELLGKGGVWLNPPFGQAEQAIELATWLQRKGEKVWLLLPARKRSRWWWRHVEPRFGKRPALKKLYELPASTEEEPRVYFEYFGGDNWGGLSGGPGAAFGVGSAMRATGPCKFPLVVLTSY